MNDLLWALLGYVVLPIWLLAGVGLTEWREERVQQQGEN